MKRPYQSGVDTGTAASSLHSRSTTMLDSTGERCSNTQYTLCSTVISRERSCQDLGFTLAAHVKCILQCKVDQAQFLPTRQVGKDSWKRVCAFLLNKTYAALPLLESHRASWSARCCCGQMDTRACLLCCYSPEQSRNTSQKKGKSLLQKV